MYYDTEQPLPATDMNGLCRRVLAHSDEEKAAVEAVLSEFFERDGEVWRHARCDKEINAFKAKQESAIRAGRASAESRFNKRSRRVQRPFNASATNQNQEPEPRTKITTTPLAQASRLSLNGSELIPLKDGTAWQVPIEFLGELERLCPRVDALPTLREIRLWCLGNQDRCKTKRGVKRFVTRWFAKEQEKALGHKG